MIVTNSILLIILSCLLNLLVVRADAEEPSARILLYKSTSTNPVAEGEDFTISYLLVNSGEVVATKIEVADRYDPKSFERVDSANKEKEKVEEVQDGTVEFSLEELVPGGQSVFNVTVRPKLYGVYESTRARIKYNSGVTEEDTDSTLIEVRNGYSTSLGRIKIISAAEYLRVSSYNLKEWGIFAFSYGLIIVIPTILYVSGKSKSDSFALQKRKSA
eukprot:gene8441-11418_t